MGKDTFFGYAAVMLLLSIGGASATPRGFEPHMLQQETVGAGHWHKYESLFWMYANTDLGKNQAFLNVISASIFS